MERIKIRAFKAVDEPATCEEFIRQHRKVLEDFGISHVNTNTDIWVHDPDTYVIIAESPNLGMVGGLRIEVASERRPLPIIGALTPLDPRITQVMREWEKEGCGEICGLWNANRFAGRGLPTLLGYAAVAIANQIGVRVLTCLIAHYTLRHALRLGFSIMEGVGEEGTFSYPIPSIKAIALVMTDTILIEGARNTHRLPVISLRVRPKQVRLEQVAAEPVLVEYDLQLDTHLVDVRAYHELHVERLRHSA
jgi:hypothetical protein